MNGECGAVSRHGGVDDEVGIRGCESLPPRNSAFRQGRLIAMGHAHEELIIKIKYCGERVAYLLFYSTMRTEGMENGARRDAGGGDGGSRALVSSPTGGNIHN